MASYETIRAERRDGYLELTLARPDRLNPLDQQSADEIRQALGDAAGREDVRAVLLRGEGRAFCAGGNVKQMTGTLDANPAEFFDAPLGSIHEAARALSRLPVPVVGAVHGFVSGAGFNLALCCDLILSSRDARFNQAFVRLGLVPDTGGFHSLPRRIGTTRAMELFLLGDFIDAEQALAWGLVNRLLDPDRLLDEARGLARRLAQGPTRAYAEIKRLLAESYGASLDRTLDAEREAQLRVAETRDFKEGLRAFLEKRPAVFLGR